MIRLTLVGGHRCCRGLTNVVAQLTLFHRAEQPYWQLPFSVEGADLTVGAMEDITFQYDAGAPLPSPTSVISNGTVLLLTVVHCIVGGGDFMGSWAMALTPLHAPSTTLG